MSIPAVIMAEVMQILPDIDGKVLFTAVNILPVPGDFVHVHITDCVNCDLMGELVEGGAYLMNLPNKLTVARIIMVPFFVVFLVNVTIPHHF